MLDSPDMTTKRVRTSGPNLPNAKRGNRGGAVKLLCVRCSPEVEEKVKMAASRGYTYAEIMAAGAESLLKP